MNTHRYTVDDLVIIDPTIARPSERDVIYRVTRLLKVNIVIERVDGAGRPVRINHAYLRPAPAKGAANSAVTAGSAVLDQPLLDAGTIVTIAGPTWKEPPGQLYVVLRDNGNGRISCVKLGGDAGRYWRGVRRGLITVVAPDQVQRRAHP